MNLFDKRIHNKIIHVMSLKKLFFSFFLRFTVHFILCCIYVWKKQSVIFWFAAGAFFHSYLSLLPVITPCCALCCSVLRCSSSRLWTSRRLVRCTRPLMLFRYEKSWGRRLTQKREREKILWSAQSSLCDQSPEGDEEEQRIRKNKRGKE